MKKIVLLLIIITVIQACSTSSKVDESSQVKINQDGEIVDPSFYQEKYLRGIDFFARGNEPNWTLEIDFENAMRFSTMDGMQFNTPPVEGVKAMDADVTNFRAQTESGDISITIARMECEDNMSGEKFSYDVRVDIKSSKDIEFTEFSGCGRYLFDYKLHDIWVLEEMTNVDLKNSELMKGLPTLEFNLREMRFGGHAGCNNLFGKIELKQNTIRFGNIGATMMACPDMKVERAVIDSLNQNLFNYKIENLKLTLENNSVKMVFKKVD
jgi:heat shock protein HslJ/uncharacterized membrane protein